MAAKRPNFLIIQADQLAPQALSVYGHPLVYVPHIEALAERGVVFENAYCNFPLCAPSRCSMLTGRYVSAIQTWDNAVELPSSAPTMMHYLNDLGYATTLCGKMHFIGPDQLHGFKERLTTDVYPSNYAWTPDWPNEPMFRPTGISMLPIVQSGKCVRSLQIDYDDDVEARGIQKIYDLARYGQDDPFFLFVSFSHPHSPFTITEKYWDLFDHDAIDMPTVPMIPVEERDKHSEWLYYAHANHLVEVTDEHVRNARHAYYGMIRYIDDKVGRLMEAMKATGLDENTVIIFLGDHGEMLGERGMWYKQTFYEWSVRVPMIVSYPAEFQARREDKLVSLVDLLPTFVDIASDGKPPEMVDPIDGNSWTGLLAGGDYGWSNEVISEYTGEGICAPCRMIRRGRYKYMYTHGHPGLLYDLDADPLELENIAERPDMAETARELRDAVLEGWDADEVNRLCLESQRRRRFILRANGGEPYWAYTAGQDGDQQYIRNAGAAPTKAKARFPFVDPIPLDE